ncbi:mitotic checkpoint protein-like protein BUB3, partial [Clohesyomyces aquaticus]
QFELAQNPTGYISAVRFAPGSSTRLLVSSWDRHVYLYDTLGEPGGTLLKKFHHKGRGITDCCWGRDDNEAFACATDGQVWNRIDLASGEQTLLSTHEKSAGPKPKNGVRHVVFVPQYNLLISGSWASSLHLHDVESGKWATVNVPGKVYALSTTPTKLIVGMQTRQNNIYELAHVAQVLANSIADPPNMVELDPIQVRESSLKYQTRTVACMPNDAGYASSSIEGRIAVEWFDPSEESQSRKYAFKCHRQTIGDTDHVYPVHALAFHPVHGTFASGGGDGVVALWDGVAKRRIRQYQKFPASVNCLEFSSDGKYMAIGVSPSFGDGMTEMPDGVKKVFIRELGDSEAMGKHASKK